MVIEKKMNGFMWVTIMKGRGYFLVKGGFTPKFTIFVLGVGHRNRQVKVRRFHEGVVIRQRQGRSELVLLFIFRGES